MNKIGIIGVGWLGRELLESLNHQGIPVKGTVSSEKKAKAFSGINGTILCFKLDDSLNVLSEYQNLDYIVITIPPSSSVNYVQELEKLIVYLIAKNENAKFIYTSSTSVYGAKADTVVDECSEPEPETNNAKKIRAIEELLLAKRANHSIILRLGGLVGGDRHPVKYLSGKEKLAKPFSPVNLVHREDIIHFICFVMNKNIKKGIFNLCSEEHPMKKEYYSWAAEKRNLAQPRFDLEDFFKDKVVTCKAIKKIGFELLYSSPYDFPNES